MAYFEDLATNSPNKYTDSELEESVSEEHEAYESLCREPKPIVSPQLSSDPLEGLE